MFSPRHVVDDHEQPAECSHSERNESLLARIRFVIGYGDGVGVVKLGNRFWHADAVFLLVDSGFALVVPLETHALSMYVQFVHISS